MLRPRRSDDEGMLMTRSLRGIGRYAHIAIRLLATIRAPMSYDNDILASSFIVLQQRFHASASVSRTTWTMGIAVAAPDDRWFDGAWSTASESRYSGFKSAALIALA